MVDAGELLVGAIDLHVHAGPSAVAREVDAAEMLREAVQAGYRAFVVKDHFFPTVMLADLVERHLGDQRVKVFGGIALNNSVGGFNLKAVDVAHSMGAKYVWMPTVSTENHIKMHKKGLRFPAARGLQVRERPIICVNDAGALKKDAVRVLEFIAATDMIIGTGHGCAQEIDALVRTAVGFAAKKIVVTHPQYMIGATLKEIAEWAGLGAYIELNACVYVPESHFKTVPLEDAAKVIETVGPERVVIVSDYGQKGNGSPVSGLKQFIELLTAKCGVSTTDIRTMVSTNPAKLLGLSA
jgi:hypothetical protein